MAHFTEDQLKELEGVFQLARKPKGIRVRDGIAQEGDMVYWRGEGGPEHVALSGQHLRNAREYPDVYQIAAPRHRIEYID